MKLKPLLIVGGLIGLVVVGAVGWYLISPLFIDNTVDEAFPFEAPAETESTEIETAALPAAEEAFNFEAPPAAEVEAMPEEDRAALEEELVAAIPSEAEIQAMPEEDQQAIEEKVVEAAAVVMMDKEMDDKMMEAAATEWTVVGQGQFAGIDSFHQGSGSAAIFAQGDQRVLRLENFEVTNGPDLHVLLIENPGATSHAELGEYIDLGSLKGNIGNQNYEIPAGVDVSTYKAVMIYCMPFHVVFATAPLS